MQTLTQLPPLAIEAENDEPTLAALSVFASGEPGEEYDGGVAIFVDRTWHLDPEAGWSREPRVHVCCWLSLGDWD